MLGRKTKGRPDHDPDWQPIELYRAGGRHLRSAGGAYIVLPYGLLAQLPSDDQAALVAILKRIVRDNPAWARDLTYEIRAWERVRPSDLDAAELAGHGITTDVDATGELAFHRDGEVLSEDVVLGHRPVVDPTPILPGTRPGARPHLLATATATATATAGRDQQFRRSRAERLTITRRRRAAIMEYAGGAIDGDWAWSIASADELWGADEQWKQLLDDGREDEPETSACPSRTAVAPPAEEVVSSVANGAKPDDDALQPVVDTPDATPTDETDRDTEFLRKLERDLQDLF